MIGLPGDLQITGAQLAALLLLVLSLLLLLMLGARVRAGRRPKLRAISAFDELPTELGRSAESGAPLHITIGSGGLGGERSLASLAAFEILEGLADAAVAYGAPPVVTVGDPTLVPLAEDALRRAHIRQGIPEQHSPTAVRFIAAQPVVYAAGAAGVTADERVSGNVLLGSFDEEVSLVTHAGEARGLPQIAGVDRLQALGPLYSADASLAAGEELYAGPARLTDFPRYVASLRVQDVLRFLLLGAILLKALGLL